MRHSIARSMPLMVFILLSLTLTPVDAVSDCQPGTPVLEIWEIQGAAHISPQEGCTVSTEDNIVTAVSSNGFWIQTPDERSDGDIATSDGVFVFTNGANRGGLEPGKLVDVTGTIVEYRPGGLEYGGLTITEFDSKDLVYTLDPADETVALPVPVLIGEGGRMPPSSVIDDDANGSVETSGSFDAADDGIDFYESLEGMRVQVNDARVVGPTNQYGEIWVVGDDGQAVDPARLTARGGVLISPTNYNPERIQLDDPLYPADWPALDVGARITSPVIGVVNYSFENYEIDVTDAFTTDTSTAVTPETTNLIAGADQLTVATYNVENLPGNAIGPQFAARADQIVNHLRVPDIVVLEEIQDNDGTGSSTTAADKTFGKLIDAIDTALAPDVSHYAFVEIDPVDGQDGGQPGGNIRVGMLYNTERVSFESRPGGDALTPNSVVCDLGGPRLQFNPGRIDPANPAFQDSRKPLAAEFMFNGQPIFVVGVHFGSKGGDDPLFGFEQPPVLNTEVKRTGQAQAVHTFVESLLDCDPDANVIVLGDVNDFAFSAPVAALTGASLHNLMDLLPENEQYSYVYEGNSQVLDQMVVSSHLFDVLMPKYDVVHVNSEFAQQVSDHEPSVARFTMP